MTEEHGTLPGRPHPLALALVRALRAPARVLIVSAGSGRHLPVLRGAGFVVETLEITELSGAPHSLARSFGGALSTHGLLHGAPSDIAAALARVAEFLRPGAPFYFTLGSSDDPRFGHGTQLGDSTWAPAEGSETGVPHTYFGHDGVRALLADWEIESLESSLAAGTAGRWSHTEAERAMLVHWFVKAHRRS